MFKRFRDFVHDESGATAIEYGLIAVLIALVLVGVLTSIGTGISNRFNSVASNLQ
jgi:pilus assembly protein Flp/PilA